MRILYLFVVMLMVSSCGYQLRGSMNVDGLENIIIISNGHTYEIIKSLDYEIIISENDSVKGTLKASGSYDFNETRMQATSEQELITNTAIDKVLTRKLIQKLRYNLKQSSQE